MIHRGHPTNYRVEICMENKKDKHTLLSLIKKHVASDTEIHTDCWKGYINLGDNGYILLRPDPGMDGPYGRTQLTYPVTHFIPGCVWIGSNECEGPDSGQRPKVSITLCF